MMDFVEGEVEYIEADHVVIGTGQGVGYRLFCPNPYTYRIKENKRVYTHHYVREDAIHLYGFPTREERNLFRKLIDVSGIGPKGALAIIAAAAPNQIVYAITQEDVAFLTKFPGIGKKTAGRLVLDLKDKLKDFTREAEADSAPSIFNGGRLEAEDNSRTSHQEAAEALSSLGYNEKEITRVMIKLKDETSTTEEIIKRALQLFIST